MMDERPDELKRARLELRLRQLRNQLDEITGGEARIGDASSHAPLEAQVAFLERVIAFETAPRTTHHNQLRQAGYGMPDPDTLADDAVGLELWGVIQRLAEMRVYLYHTDHLSDRGLYELLYYELLDQEVVDLPPDENSAAHLDVLGSGSDDDTATWLRYFASDTERREWQAAVPAARLPPSEKPPEDRDRLLPKRTYPTQPLQAALEALMRADLDDPAGVIRFSADLTAEETAGAGLPAACRVLLEHLGQAGEVKATAKLGNLARAFVKEVYQHLPLPKEKRASIDRYIKALNEEDIPLLHQARVTCAQARLLARSKGRFSLTQRGKELLAPGRAGEFYRVLFIAFFNTINLGYWDRLGDGLAGLQDTLPVILWRLAAAARDWVAPAALIEATLLPLVREQVEDREAKDLPAPGWTVEIRLWQHLEAFGLLESRRKSKAKWYASPDAYRVTRLFGRFISFHLPQP